MLHFFYTLIIFPVEQIIEFIFVCILRIFRNPGISIIGVSITVSTLILPIYLMAEKQQQQERDKQKQMKGRIDTIKAVFKGDKRYMLLATLYRQRHYHPVYALRNSIDLFIQIPFFIAAYHFLHNLEILGGKSFFFIKDLGAPDRLFAAINILPVLMTLINCVSGAIYTRGLFFKDKIQVYSMAALFLVLLYNSPSALVLYWTCNNIYNLNKNILIKTRHSKYIIYGICGIGIACLSVYLLLFQQGSREYHLIVVCISVIALLFPLWKKIILSITGTFIKNSAIPETSDKIFMLSLVSLFLLIGFVIPSALIASSAGEFSYLKPFSSPLPYLGITLLQSAGIFLWLLCIYKIFGKKARTILTYLLTVCLSIFLTNSFIFPGKYGSMDSYLRIADFTDVSDILKAVNSVCILLALIASLFLLMRKNALIVSSVQSILIIALLSFGILNIINIKTEFNNLKQDRSIVNDKVYSFTQTGKNVLVIMLDQALPRFVPYIFREKPDLLRSYSGFSFYPNTVSYGSATVYGMPCILGGLYYTPEEIQKRNNEPFLEKFSQSMMVLPRIMADAHCMVTIQDLPWTNELHFKQYKNINIGSSRGNFTKKYLDEFENFKLIEYYDVLYSNLLRFSLFKVSPLLLRRIIYDNGSYLSILNFHFSKKTIDSYTSLYYLNDITEITNENEDYCTIMVNDLTHDSSLLELPDYTPSNYIGVNNLSMFPDDAGYHCQMAAFLLLAKWFEFLKENNVYDNTRIIIASDHGRKYKSPFPDRITVPDGADVDRYTALLMVKDFNDKADFITDNRFMTNADVPSIAINGLTDNVVNPFSGRELMRRKADNALITTAVVLTPFNQKKYGLKIRNNEWLYVHDNIYDPANWTSVTVD